MFDQHLQEWRPCMNCVCGVLPPFLQERGILIDWLWNWTPSLVALFFLHHSRSSTKPCRAQILLYVKRTCSDLQKPWVPSATKKANKNHTNTNNQPRVPGCLGEKVKHTRPIPLHSAVLLKEKVTSHPIFFLYAVARRLIQALKVCSCWLEVTMPIDQPSTARWQSIVHPVSDFHNLVPKFTCELNSLFFQLSETPERIKNPYVMYSHTCKWKLRSENCKTLFDYKHYKTYTKESIWPLLRHR